MSNPESLHKQTPVISCQNLWKVFGGNVKPELHKTKSSDELNAILENSGGIKAVSDVTLDVHEGEIVVLMGLSGSGKSTLLRCLSRLIEPSCGTLDFEGVDLLAMDSKALRQLRRNKIGMVFQNFALLPHRTVLGNIELPLEIRGVGKAKRQTKALELVEMVGLSGRESYYPRELSGGQQQRVGIGRSLASDPEVWFLDEPFSALDPMIRRELQDELLRLQKSLKKTIVFVTHDFDEAVKISNRIALMRDGKIVQCGSALELLLNPADDYVREFVSDVDWTRIIRLRDIMGPVDASLTDVASISNAETLRSVAAITKGDTGPWIVTDENDKTVGSLKAETLSSALSDAAAQIAPNSTH